MGKGYCRFITYTKEYIEKAPRLVDLWRVPLDSHNGIEGLAVRFDYNTNTSKQVHSCTLPLYTTELKQVKIPAPTKKRYVYVNYLDYVVKFLIKPVTMMGASIVYGFNLYNMLFGMHVTNIAMQSIASLVLPWSGVLIGCTIVHGITAVFFRYIYPKMQQNFINIFDSYLQRIDSINCISTDEVFWKLKHKHWILFDQWMPCSAYLIFQYHYSLAIIHEIHENLHAALNDYQCALPFAQTERQGFACICRITQVYHDLCKEPNWDATRYYSYIQKYIDVVPDSLDLHKPKIEQLTKEIDDTIALLARERVFEAYEKFDDIYFDAVADEFYPHIAVRYYQLKAIITLLGHPYKGYLRCVAKADMHKVLESEHQERIVIARHSLLKAQSYLDDYYPDIAREHRKYVWDLEQFWENLPVRPLVKFPYDIEQFGVKLRTIITDNPHNDPQKDTHTQKKSSRPPL